jgi:large subunit ribosomal protein L22
MNKVEACLRMVRISRWKLNDIAAQVRKQPVEKAVRILDGMKKRAAKDVRKVVMSAVANAAHNFGLSAERLVVAEATVGRSMILKRMDVRGRSRMGRIEKEFSQIRVVLVVEE